LRSAAPTNPLQDNRQVGPLRSIIYILAVVVCGLALGGASAWYSIQRSHGIGAINVGPWNAFPFAGADEIDPYSVAKSVADGTVPLGVAEGLAFETVFDSQGSALTLSCEYRLEGMTPPARLWTLVAYDREGNRLKPAPGGRAALFSNSTLRYPDGSFLISISKSPKPGNWLSLDGSGGFRLVLRLYDTPISGNTELSALTMPSITRAGCRT
jgi:hypothetical protein